MKIEGDFDAFVGRLLSRLPDVEVIRAKAGGLSGREPDAIVSFAGSKTPVLIEAKRRLNAAAAWQIVALAGERELPVIAIAEETTDEARKILSSHRIGIVDGLGNADLRLPGLWMHLGGNLQRAHPGAAPTAAPKARLSGKTGVAAQALLLEPERRWKVRELAARAGVSSGLAHRVLARLEDEGLMEATGAGPAKVRVLTDPGGLLDLLAEEMDVRPLRTPAFRLAQSPTSLIRGVAAALEAREVDYALTGAGAASLVAPFVSALPILEVWVSSHLVAPDRVLDEFGMEKAETGQNVEFLQANDDGPLMFRQRTDRAWVANPFRLYVDLLHDPRRGREQAEVLRREVIGF